MFCLVACNNSAIKPHRFIFNPYIKGKCIIRLIEYNLVSLIRFHTIKLHSDAQAYKFLARWRRQKAGSALLSRRASAISNLNFSI